MGLFQGTTFIGSHNWVPFRTPMRGSFQGSFKGSFIGPLKAPTVKGALTGTLKGSFQRSGNACFAKRSSSAESEASQTEDVAGPWVCGSRVSYPII